MVSLTVAVREQVQIRDASRESLDFNESEQTDTDDHSWPAGCL